MHGDWELSGTVLVGCNCDYGCPATSTRRPRPATARAAGPGTSRRAATATSSSTASRSAVFADWPGAIHEGEARRSPIYDERADERQREALENLLRGGEGGPWGIFINTYELLDVLPAPILFNASSEHSGYKIGDYAELTMEPIRNPVTGAEVRASVVLPTGLVFNEGWCGCSTVFKVEGAVAYDHSGKNAEYAPFSYAAPA